MSSVSSHTCSVSSSVDTYSEVISWTQWAWRMLTYADVCWRMLTYADVCWRMLTLLTLMSSVSSSVDTYSEFISWTHWAHQLTHTLSSSVDACKHKHKSIGRRKSKIPSSSLNDESIGVLALFYLYFFKSWRRAWNLRQKSKIPSSSLNWTEVWISSSLHDLKKYKHNKADTPIYSCWHPGNVES